MIQIINYHEAKEVIIENHSTRPALINAIKEFDNIDPKDAIQDIELLLALFEAKHNNIINDGNHRINNML